MRVAVTVSADRFERVARAFEMAGLEPVALSCMRIETSSPETIATAREAAAGADLLVLSSTRTLEILWPAGAFPATPVAAVGVATADAVRGRGGIVEFEGSDGAAALAREARLEGRSVVFPHAAGTDVEALDVMRRRSGSFAAPVVYETYPQAPAGDPVGAVAFGSPSAVHGWTLKRSMSGLLIGVIGSTTARAVANAERLPDVIAPTPKFESLGAAMAARLERVT